MSELVVLVLVATVVLLADMLSAGVAKIVPVSTMDFALELTVVLEGETVSVVLFGFRVHNLKVMLQSRNFDRVLQELLVLLLHVHRDGVEMVELEALVRGRMLMLDVVMVLRFRHIVIVLVVMDQASVAHAHEQRHEDNCLEHFGFGFSKEVGFPHGTLGGTSRKLRTQTLASVYTHHDHKRF